MTSEDMQKLGKDGMEAVMSSFGVWTKSAQAIAGEVADYSKKSADDYSAAWEKLMAARSLDKAMEVQSEYLKSSYEDFVARAAKMSELYTDLANEAVRPLAKAYPTK